MYIDLMRNREKILPVFNLPLEIKNLRIWHCKYKSLSGIRVLKNLETLVIATYPDKTLDTLGYLNHLTYLSIVHLPYVTDLSPLSELKNLVSLSLSTLPSWDTSGRTTEVESLEPICQLPRLRHLELLGVRSKDKSLLPLERIKSLTTARISQFPFKEIERFYAETQISNKFVPEPNFIES